MNPFSRWFSLALLLLMSFQVTAKEKSSLYMPLNYQKAYKMKTRSFDGRPGENYWQNASRYTIRATLIPDSSLLKGEETIVYINNSPDTLQMLVFRLYQDYYRRGNARGYPVDPEDLTNGTRISLLQVENDTLIPAERTFRVRRTQSNLIVRLPRRLRINPGDSIDVRVVWSFHIPEKRKLRMGRYSKDNFFIAYWYPQISVYDDIDGWDTHNYMGPAEFYNDFNDYQVALTLPGDFFVWSTGQLQNPKQIYTEKLLSRLNQALESDSTVQIICPSDSLPRSGLLPSSQKTWNITARHVTDFSFAVSRTNLWDAASVVVDSVTGRRALTSAVYPADSPNYERAAEISAETIRYLSHELPGVPYPYPHVTTYCNGPYGGGMETPMMANDGAPRRWSSAVDLISHEISHNYFPFYMGTNERKYGWMDEGWATFLPGELVARMAPEDDYLSGFILRYQIFAGDEMEMPPMIPTLLLGEGGTMQTASYSRPAVAYYMLNVLLGDELFRKALREYIYRWHGKHPTPYDFFFTFNDVTGQDLTWFWKPWFFQRGYPDLALRAAARKGDQLEIEVERIGEIPIPIAITLEDENGSQQKLSFSAETWKKGESHFTTTVQPKLKVKRVLLGNRYIPDVNQENNEIVLE